MPAETMVSASDGRPADRCGSIGLVESKAVKVAKAVLLPPTLTQRHPAVKFHAGCVSVKLLRA